MNLESFQYMICDENKRPIHSFDKTYTYDEVKDKDNVAIKLEEPYLIVDIDDEDQFNILVHIIKDLKIRTRILKTSRGGHFWFKSLKPIKNVVHSNTPITLKIDIKSWGKASMEVIKRNGEWRQWIQYDEIIDVLPSFLKPISYKKDVLHYKDGDGRDTALFTFIIPLVNENMSAEEIRNVFYLINQYIFDEPLTPAEIDKMFVDNTAFKSNTGIFYKGSRFLHNVFADHMMEEYKIRGFGNDFFFYYENQYTNNKDLLTAQMIKIIPELNTSNIKEVIENIRLKTISSTQCLNSRYVTLKNGLYNIYTDEFIEHTPEIFTLHQVNCYYDRKAYNQDVFNTIKSLACNNEDIITILIQMLGYFLVNDCRFQKSFILLGNGRNGKSMFLDMIRNWLGEENCSSLALEDLSERFRTAELVGKMVNIGDDSGHHLLENTAIFKKLVTGNSITIERKNQNPFKFQNKAKMIFAANSLPPTTDKSEGFFRRCVVIPFNAVYKETDEGYNPNLIDLLTTEEAKSYLFNLAIKGLRSLLDANMFYIPDDSKSINEYYELSNNNIMMWYNGVVDEYEDVQKAFTDYLLYCVNNNYKPNSIGRFQQEYERLKKGFK